MAERWLGWHFLRADSQLQYLPRTLVVEGQTLYATTEPLELCVYGLHASVRALDALKYAPGPIACRVILAGKIVTGGDKACATERTCLKKADASAVLREFSCWCTEQALANERQRGREPDKRSWNAVAAARKWLGKEISGKELEAAYTAACKAADATDAAYAALAASSAARSASCAAEYTAHAAVMALAANIKPSDAAREVVRSVTTAVYAAAKADEDDAEEAVYQAMLRAATTGNGVANRAAVEKAAEAVYANGKAIRIALPLQQNEKLEEMLNELLYGKETSNG